MNVTGTNLYSKYHITPDQLIARLRQLNSLQRELFFMESIAGEKGLNCEIISPSPSFMSTLRQAMNIAPPIRNYVGTGKKTKVPEAEINGQDVVSSRNSTQNEIQGGSEVDIGAISRRFESKADPVAGVGTIGYDPNGGTSYGIYQLSSKQGAVDQFIKFLENRRPDWANRLRSAGSPNTGSTSGRFPSEWKAIAYESPHEFAKLQEDFIRERYFEPACSMIKSETGIDIHSEPKALQEMVWSMAVQHGVGGAVTIFKRSLQEIVMGNGQVNQVNSVSREEIVEQVYALRATKFSSSPPQVRQAVIRRFQEEKNLILAGLNRGERLSQWS